MYIQGTENMRILEIPNIYFICLNEIYKYVNIGEKESVELPYINVKISCYDIQENSLEYIYSIPFSFDPEGGFEMTSNSGNQKKCLLFNVAYEDIEIKQNRLNILAISYYFISIVAFIAFVCGSGIYIYEEVKSVKTEQCLSDK